MQLIMRTIPRATATVPSPPSGGVVRGRHPGRLEARLKHVICFAAGQYGGCAFDVATAGALEVETTFDFEDDGADGSCSADNRGILISALGEMVIGLRFSDGLDAAQVNDAIPVVVLVSMSALNPDATGDWETAEGDCTATVSAVMPWGHDPVGIDNSLQHAVTADVACNDGTASPPDGSDAQGTVTLVRLQISASVGF